jgi:hypothetical protein
MNCCVCSAAGVEGGTSLFNQLRKYQNTKSQL